MVGRVLFIVIVAMFYYVTITFSTKISVCRQIDPQTYHPNNIQQQCIGQTVFLQEQEIKGGNATTFNMTRLKVAESEIKKLKNDVATLQQQLKDDRKAFYLGYKNLTDGWVTLFNGYQYKLNSTGQTWNKSREMCQSWGGDLAVYGVQSMHYRQVLAQALSITSEYWIGLRIQKKLWVWVNGEYSSPASIYWQETEPNRAYEKCVDIRPGIFGRTSNDERCTSLKSALCEKKILADFLT